MEDEFQSDLYFSIKMLSQVLSRMAEEEFRSVGLAPSYAFLLMAVDGKPGIQPSELSEILGLKPSTITRLIDKMEHRGYLKRVSQGRATNVEPTEKCLSERNRIENAWKNLVEKYKGVLGDRYTEVLTEMTVKATEQLEKPK